MVAKMLYRSKKTYQKATVIKQVKHGTQITT